ncbi:hypothetical protein BGZ63DRAFT_357638 [Mariannaea sp. PMI_226]|nr:hypothetical protein BGZ63DRAFT_357638 [Mariannaea sp. PMI_226]
MDYSPISPLSGEPTSTSSTTSQTGCSFSPYSTRRTSIFEFHEDSQPPEASLPTLYSQQYELNQVQHFAHPPDALPNPEVDTLQESKDVPSGRVRSRIRTRTRAGKRKAEQKGNNSKRVKKENSNAKANPRDARRRLILERNKAAATRCRKRKQDEASALAACEEEMEQSNGQLKKEFDELTAEIYFLKTQLLRHTDCSCILIHKYIANEARKSVDTITPPPTLFQPKPELTVECQPSSNGSILNGSLTCITDPYGMPTPGLENVPPIWADSSLLDASSPKAMLRTTMAQNEYMPPSSEPPMPWMQPMDGASYPGSWIGPGASFPVIEVNAIWDGREPGIHGDIVQHFS